MAQLIWMQAASSSQIAPALGFRWIFNEEGVDDYFILVAARSVSEDTVRHFDNWFVFPALAKDPFDGPAGDPPAFRGTLVLRDGKELARGFWKFGFLARHGYTNGLVLEKLRRESERLE